MSRSSAFTSSGVGICAGRSANAGIFGFSGGASRPGYGIGAAPASVATGTASSPVSLIRSSLSIPTLAQTLGQRLPCEQGAFDPHRVLFHTLQRLQIAVLLWHDSARLIFHGALERLADAAHVVEAAAGQRLGHHRGRGLR